VVDHRRVLGMVRRPAGDYRGIASREGVSPEGVWTEPGRPHADRLKGSRIRNLKELRAKTESHVLRVLYFFDERRQALLLVGGDKKGKNERSFYKRLIAEAEGLVERYRR
jgi:hypothetical protein